MGIILRILIAYTILELSWNNLGIIENNYINENNAGIIKPSTHTIMQVTTWRSSNKQQHTVATIQCEVHFLSLEVTRHASDLLCQNNFGNNWM